jgi:PHD/YefM family antitoxin component YafN of YafNO toxin-antitoxin module
MNTITFSVFEANFDAIIEDVGSNKATYKIVLEQSNNEEPEKAVMLIPYEEYDYLQEVYKESLETKKVLEN